jgi:hypothetical protein
MHPTRRNFLRALGYGAAMSPFVPFLNQQAEAQATGYPTRLLLVFTGNGSVPSQFWPTGSDANYSFVPGSITESLAPFKSKLIFPKNLKRVQTGGGGHESAMVPIWAQASRNTDGKFGGYSTQPSVDQIIAQAIPKDGIAFPSLEFGVMSNGAGANIRLLTVMSYAGNDQPIQPESNPYNMFTRLMLGSASVPGVKPEDLERIRLRRQSSLDLVRNELRTLSGKIDTADRIKLQQHVAGLEAIEKRLTMPSSMPSSGIVTGPPRVGIDLTANDSFPEILSIQNSMAVAALASNRTRVASLMWGRSFSLVRHTWVGVTKEHHTLSHETTPESELQKQAIETWFMKQMADLLKQLDSVPEGDGTLLDHTMVIYANELAVGSLHTANPAITLVAGSGGGKLKTGRLLELGPTYDFPQLLCTACHVMGVTSVTRIGDMGNTGIIPAILA